MDFLALQQTEVFLQLILAVVLGGLVGLEREWKRKEAGLRTFALVCFGSTLFTILAIESFGLLASDQVSFDPSRIIGQLVVGIGFLGAGVIIFRERHVEGLTTAAGLWVTAAIGAALGFKFYTIAVFAALLALLTFSVMSLIEARLLKSKSENKL